MGSYHIPFSFNIAADTEGPFEKADKAGAGLAPGWAQLQRDAVLAEGTLLAIPKPRDEAAFTPRAPYG